ncbi:MAG: Asp-tRNA(Asn)/Glu-tRNA(Gln) amidotransferase subunit GatB [Deltaproteobacteria bacterium]|nr:Asp-tRNA(Asn)/Glu-tRNA(Gln) amidotransferase subunit GatB [Deltaproteobacteria bacterium]MBT6431482.1 Asp-tRNA(Asn)/Glu-tRNA(Gln) amidotransferase subunit GatB [Deltaproteobacteria bacterium]
MSYEIVIGLEVHAQLRTESKLFSTSGTAFGASANAQTDVVCLGMPGVLPVLNKEAVRLAVKAGIALECEVHQASQFSRKHYFYPDLAKGYQITQFDRPYATWGKLDIEVGGSKKTVGITRIHMEEDAGKSVHDDLVAGGRSYIDYNRAGVPLIEIVSEPDMRSADEAVAYLKKLHQILRYIEVCDGNMEQGSFRCDANVSLRPVGQKELGTRTELKNINSFRFVQQAIEYEVSRQASVLDSGGRIIQETRLWDTKTNTTRSMRSKEEAHDYRYFPEPDLPDLILEDGYIEALKEALPELPAARLSRYESEYGLGNKEAKVLTEDIHVAVFFEKALARHNNAKLVANWTINEVLREAKGDEVNQLAFGPQALGELVELIDNQTISGKIAKEVFQAMLETGTAPGEYVEQKGLKQVTDTSAIEAIVDGILARSEAQVAQYKDGNMKVLGFFVGQVMKESRGKANPKIVNEILKEKLK